MRSYWSTLGMILGLFLILDGFIGWFLGIEYSNPIRHSITIPYAQIALIVSPILTIGGVVLFLVSIVYRRREKPAPPPAISPKELKEYRKKRSKNDRREEVEEAAPE